MIRGVSKILVAGACVLAVSTPALAGNFKILHTFKGGAADGKNANPSLTFDGQGNLYGTTRYGGSTLDCHGEFHELGCGTVFRIAPDGTETILYSFQGATDAAYPLAGVTIGPDGALYGSTYGGGGLGDCGGDGCGTVFRITSEGQESILHRFGNAGDGSRPRGVLAIDKKGNLYGVTETGGDPSCDCGTVFKISARGREKVLHAFTGNAVDGAEPFAGPLLDKGGTIYGTTDAGGTGSKGTVYKLATDGTESVLYSFQGADGAEPDAELMKGKGGNLYSTTSYGGAGDYGEVFKLTTTGQLTVLYSFKGYIAQDGALPTGGVTADSDGNLYGTLFWDGCCGGGFVYRIGAGGAETLYNFTDLKQGYRPGGTLVSDGSGNLYGANYQGGNLKGVCGQSGCGTIFRFTP